MRAAHPAVKTPVHCTSSRTSFKPIFLAVVLPTWAERTCFNFCYRCLSVFCLLLCAQIRLEVELHLTFLGVPAWAKRLQLKQPLVFAKIFGGISIDKLPIPVDNSMVETIDHENWPVISFTKHYLKMVSEISCQSEKVVLTLPLWLQYNFSQCDQRTSDWDLKTDVYGKPLTANFKSYFDFNSYVFEFRTICIELYTKIEA